MRRRTLMYLDKVIKPIEEATYSDICFVDNNSLEKIIVNAEEFNDDFPTDNYTPIGVVAVPSSHTDNHRPRLISLVNMSCDTPESGTIYSNNDYIMKWGY